MSQDKTVEIFATKVRDIINESGVKFYSKNMRLLGLCEKYAPSRPYPKHMSTANGLVILFNEYGNGTVQIVGD